MKRQYSEQLKKGVIELALLSLISEVPRYGYNIIKELEKRTTGYFRVKGGTIYPVLRRLETNGLIKSGLFKTTQRQARRYYEITAEGRQFLAKRLEEWESFLVAVSQLVRMSGKTKVIS